MVFKRLIEAIEDNERSSTLELNLHFFHKLIALFRHIFPSLDKRKFKIEGDNTEDFDRLIG